LNGRNSLIYRINPDLDDAYNLLMEGISKHLTVILVGEFNVNYEGRAASTLDFGERILIIKRDGAVLVHRADGYEPVNWQPGGGIINAVLDEDTLILRAIRKAPRETLKLSFRKIKALMLLKLKDTSRFYLYASEEEMRKAILTKPELIEDYEKKVKPGFIDVYGVDSKGRLVVIEIKRVSAGRDAVLQLARYIESLKKESSREVRGGTEHGV